MPVKIFFCYAHEDILLLNRLKSHLSSMQRQRIIDVWHDRDISAGTEWERQISEQLNSAEVILLLVSPYFIASDYCYSKEMKRAMERHESGEARVIPILLRPVQWTLAPFSKLQVLPTNARPVTRWGDREEAFFNIAEGIRKVVEEPSLELLHINNLIAEFQSLLKSREPDRYRFRTVVRRMITDTKNILDSPLFSSADGQTLYFHQNLRLGELNLALDDLPNAFEAYQCAYQYAQENETIDDIRLAIEIHSAAYERHQETYEKTVLTSRYIPLIFESGIPLACVLAYLQCVEEAIVIFKSVIEKLAEAIQDKSINIESLLQYTVYVSFYEHFGMANPLLLVFNQDHYRLNIRVQQAIDALYATFKEMMGKSFRKNEGSLALGFARLLESFGVLRPALKYYQIAQRKGNIEAAKQIETVQSSLETASWMVKSFVGIPDTPLPKGGLVLNNSKAFTRILLSSGSTVITDMDDVFEEINRSKQDVEELNFWTNGISPVHILIYEDFPESSENICTFLTDMGIGVAVVIRKDEAKQALQEIPTIRMYVADHRPKVRKGLVNIGSIRFQPDVLNEEYPNVISTMLCLEPDDGPAKSFENSGGYIIDARDKTEEDLAQALIEILQKHA